jgi:hypothetical protein
MEKTINLENILLSIMVNQYIDSDNDEIITFIKSELISAMKEAIKQSLGLAAENAILVKYTDNFGVPAVYLDKQSILKVIELIK